MAVIASQPTGQVNSRLSHGWWKPAVVVVVIVVALVGVGFAGWAIRGEDHATTRSVSSTPAVSSEQGLGYIALASVVGPRCPGIGPAVEGPAGQCETSLVSMAAFLRGSTWPVAARAQAAALATAIDKQIAFLQRVDKATPAEVQQMVGNVMKDPSNSPWQVTNRAAAAFREAIGLGGSGSSLL